MLLKKSLYIRAKLIIASASTVATAMVLLTSMNVWSARQSTESLVMQQVRALSESGVHGLSEWAANKIEVVNALGVASRYADPVQALGQAQHGGGFQVSYMAWADKRHAFRSEEHTSELQSLMRISYAVFCLNKKNKKIIKKQKLK